MSELKNCPFCGSVAEYEGDSIYCTNFNCGVATASDWTENKVKLIWDSRVIQKEWTSVIKSPPPEDTLVNICGGDIEGTSSGWYSPLHNNDNSSFILFEDDELVVYSATHWMPLPLPKEENKQ